MKDHNAFKRLLIISYSQVTKHFLALAAYFALSLVPAAGLTDENGTTPDAIRNPSSDKLDTTVGDIVEPSDRELIKALVSAAESGSGEAALALGNRYFHGKGVTKDRAAAIEWWRLGMSLDSPEAAYNLGVAYVNAYGTEKDLGQATAAFSNAAQHDIPKAHLALGVITLHLAKNDAETRQAGEHFRHAAKLGDPIAQHNLSVMYADGIGFPVDKEKAAYWLELSSKKPMRNPAHRTTQEIQSVEWIKSRDPKNYTLQVASGDTFVATKKLIAEVATLKGAVFAKMLANSERFVAIAGDFTSYSEAEKALETLPDAIRQNSPFIVKFDVLQRQIDEHTKFNN
ncbi:MAG: SPOR domain-containing protein [Gammaproteobacteria bacterium]